VPSTRMSTTSTFYLVEAVPLQLPSEGMGKGPVSAFEVFIPLTTPHRWSNKTVLSLCILRLLLDIAVYWILFSAMHSLLQSLTGNSGLVVEPQDKIDPEVNIAGKDQNVDIESETVSIEAQDGVKDIEAITSVWTRSHLIAAYVMLIEQQCSFVVVFGKTDSGMIGSGLSIFSTQSNSLQQVL
jgi:hypothetical protein